MVLQRLEVGVAYPMLSLNFVLVTLVARYVLAEPADGRHWLGVGLIVAGVVVHGSGLMSARGVAYATGQRGAGERGATGHALEHDALAPNRGPAGHARGPVLFQLLAVAVLLLGIFGYAASLVCWLAALGDLPLNRAYSMLSLSYPLVYLCAAWLPGFGGSLSVGKTCGVILVVLGVVLINARSTPPARVTNA